MDELGQNRSLAAGVLSSILLFLAVRRADMEHAKTDTDLPLASVSPSVVWGSNYKEAIIAFPDC